MHVSRPSFTCYEFHPRLRYIQGPTYRPRQVWLIQVVSTLGKPATKLVLSLTQRWSRLIQNEKQPRSWALRRINRRWFYSHSPNCKERKKRFDKEEEYEENGFILIHLVGKKMGLKENKEKKMVWKRRRGLGRWLYSHSLSCK